jgi:hypothetical protein
VGPSPVAGRRRQLALTGVALLATSVIVAVVVTDLGVGGLDRPGPGSDIGAHSDASALADVVQTALSEAEADKESPSPTACAGEARATYGKGLGPLVYAASLRWQGTPAVLLTYRVDGARAGGLDHRALVLSRAGCQLLVVQTL